MKIHTFETSLNDGTPIKEKKEVIKDYVQPTKDQKKGRTYKSKVRDVYRQFMADLLEKNEQLIYQKKALTDKEMFKILIKKYTYNYDLKRKLLRYKLTIGMFRISYNKRELYAAQPPVYLLSLPYNEWSIPMVGGTHKYTYLSFEQAYQRCLEYKIGDPRFIPPELLAKVRDRINSQDPEWLDWMVPDDKWISKFETSIQMEAYNSLRFPVGWTREDTPIE